MKPFKKYIITGPPGSGKSTLIKAIENQGISCIKEVSRDIIIQEQEKGLDGMPWKDIERFTDLVFTETKCRLAKQPLSRFTDRSLMDNIAYLQHHKKAIPMSLKTFNYNQYYNKVVFFTPSWKSIYTTDQQRPQQFEAQLALEYQLKQTYLNFGFTLIEIPRISVIDRVDFIMNSIVEKNLCPLPIFV